MQLRTFFVSTLAALPLLALAEGEQGQGGEGRDKKGAELHGGRVSWFFLDAVQSLKRSFR